EPEFPGIEIDAEEPTTAPGEISEPEAVPVPESGKKEAFETETLAELYIAQGFYDRAINIYKNLIIESPSDMRLRQKLEDLYLLVNIGKEIKKEEAAEVSEADVAGDVLSVWQAESPESDAMNSWEFYGEEEKKRDKGIAPPQPEAESKNRETVERLEKFLEKIRRKAGQ
ncbi:MAG: tetratricopeptide repeat protein, partial [Nitrospirota bacterium]